MTSRKGRQYTVKSIVKVENPFLLAQYYLRKKQLGKSVEDYEMYHGTGGESLIPICTNNFNWRFCGVSFSPRADYSKHFVTEFSFHIYPKLQNSGRGSIIFFANVLKGNTHIGNMNTVVPIEGFDTTDNFQSTVCVKYQDFEFYPKYVILIH
ncbi:protein mono-ADP-ribosyltransferase PARP12-like [Aethina tumida]|uniref:protein mono-ADP-ribosyltransferase PARP12-like n=1 Tax=Aethina tumida TaxID=116153 RepID=UPI0021476653|nr:protein mono-ADP-ribosyltransferase PARP12-like [Aethina tumida]